MHDQEAEHFLESCAAHDCGDAGSLNFAERRLLLPRLLREAVTLARKMACHFMARDDRMTAALCIAFDALESDLVELLVKPPVYDSAAQAEAAVSACGESPKEPPLHLAPEHIERLIDILAHWFGDLTPKKLARVYESASEPYVNEKFLAAQRSFFTWWLSLGSSNRRRLAIILADG